MRLTTILATIMIISPAIIAADTAASRELEDLQKKRARELTDSVEQINRKYQPALEQLLRRATQASDLETALKIKEALAANTPAPVLTGFEGDWIIRYRGQDISRQLLADHTITEKGAVIGKWRLTASQLILDFNWGEADKYNLPLRDNKLTGTNPHKDHLIATKVK